MDFQEDSDIESVDSDKELQVAFSKGLLKPGLNIELAPERKPLVNNVELLKHTTEELKKVLTWSERLDLTVEPAAPAKPMLEQLGADPDDLTGEAVHDDFKREMKFYRQAQAAALKGIPKLKALGIPTKRPQDYFAEMAKTDDHMKKVREKLISKQISMERSEKAKKMRDLRKYGKKVQQEVLAKRQKEKKDMLDAVKKYRKGHETKLDFLEETSGKGKDSKTSQKKEVFQPNKRRQFKNKKFGFGGQKKRSKYNTKTSASDMSGFSSAKHSSRPGKFKKANQGKIQRPGKSKRQKMKKK